MKPKSLCEGRFLRLSDKDGWEYCERVIGSSVVTIVALTDDNELILTEQFRIPLNRSIIELPAGLVGDEPGSEQESVFLAGARELEEETGYRAGSLEALTDGPTSAGLTTEYLHFLRANDLVQIGEGGGTDNEDIIVHCIPLDRVPGFLSQCRQDNRMVDPKIYAGLWFLAQESAQ